jgi:cbb3-type cytochrome oxidase cytochrome c subunit
MPKHTLKAGDLVAGIPVTDEEIQYASADYVNEWMKEAQFSIQHARWDSKTPKERARHIAAAMRYLRTAQVAQAIKESEAE